MLVIDALHGMQGVREPSPRIARVEQPLYVEHGIGEAWLDRNRQCHCHCLT